MSLPIYGWVEQGYAVITANNKSQYIIVSQTLALFDYKWGT